MDQQHPGRQEFTDLWDPHEHRGAGRRVQHLPRPLRRRADGVDGKRLGDDRSRSRRPCHHRSQECRPLFRHRRAEGHRGLLRPANLAGDRGAQVRLGAERPQPRRGLAEGRRAEDFQDLSRPGDRQVRLSRHQGSEDRMGNGADGRTVRRGGDDSRRRHLMASAAPTAPSGIRPAAGHPPSSGCAAVS